MSLTKNTAYNMVGTIAPLMLALVTVPAYLKIIGPERYGVLSLAWLILGYFGVFDLGLGRAATQRIAALRDDTAESRATAFGTALISNLVIGFVGALVLWPVAYFAFSKSIDMAPALRLEAIASAPMLGLALPIATTMGMLSGSLVGRQRFRQVNKVSVLSTVIFQLFPLSMAFMVGPDLRILLAASIAARCFGLSMFWRACAREFGRDAFRRFDPNQLKALLSYGGWITVTGLATPMLVMTDRFLVGRSLGAIGVTLYTVPTQITTRLSPIAGALGSALFPRFACADAEESNRLTSDGIFTLFALMTAPVALGIGLIEPALRLWLGDGIGIPAAPVGRIMLATAWINVFGQVPYWRLQARGNPEKVALVQLAEVPFYIPLLLVLLANFGLAGAALAAMARMIVDAAVLQWLSARRVFNVVGTLTALVLFAAEDHAIRLWHPGIGGAIAISLVSALVALLISWIVLPIHARNFLADFIARMISRVRPSTTAPA